MSSTMEDAEKWKKNVSVEIESSDQPPAKKKKKHSKRINPNSSTMEDEEESKENGSVEIESSNQPPPRKKKNHSKRKNPNSSTMEDEEESESKRKNGTVEMESSNQPPAKKKKNHSESINPNSSTMEEEEESESKRKNGTVEMESSNQPPPKKKKNHSESINPNSSTVEDEEESKIKKKNGSVEIESSDQPPANKKKKNHSKRLNPNSSTMEDEEESKNKRKNGSVEMESSNQPPPNKKKKNKPESAIYGNYRNYYGYRIEQDSEEDPRFKVLKKEWFEGKECLDIGCNSGLITITIAKKFCCRSILGIDIDSGRINDAYWTLRKIARRSNGQIPADSLFDKVSFEAENFVQHWCSYEANRYDTITCFSVTKWVHLNWGDEGLITLFAKIWRLLRPGGILVLEPQPWQSYYKNRQVSEIANTNYKNIEIFPEDFQEILLDKIGFRMVENISSGLPGTKKTGFNRPILALWK